MKDKYYHIVIALSGIVQNAYMVSELALKGTAKDAHLKTAIDSILKLDATSTSDCFNGTKNIVDGLELLVNFIDNSIKNKNKQMLDAIKYIYAAMLIAKKIVNKDANTKDIETRLTNIKNFYISYEKENITSNTDEITRSLAGIYSDYISPLTTQIKVHGKREFLENKLVQNKVRTFLFAAVRAAVLWYQVGGNRSQFLFLKKKLLITAKNIIKNDAF